MVTRGRRKDTDRHQAAKYRNVGSALLQSAKDLEDLATDETRYGNATSVIAIHAAIAYNDAITIAYGGFKSTEGEHVRAPDALLAALKNPSPEAVDLLRAVVKKKDAVSYQEYTVRGQMRPRSSARRSRSARGPRKHTSGARPRDRLGCATYSRASRQPPAVSCVLVDSERESCVTSAIRRKWKRSFQNRKQRMREINTGQFWRATSVHPRESNRKIVLNLVREHEPLSRADVAGRMRLRRDRVIRRRQPMAGAAKVGATTRAAAPRRRVCWSDASGDTGVEAVPVVSVRSAMAARAGGPTMSHAAATSPPTTILAGFTALTMAASPSPISRPVSSSADSAPASPERARAITSATVIPDSRTAA